MKEYFYLNGSERVGPIDETELIKLNLDINTLIWTEGIDNWTALRNIPSLQHSIPPPVPQEIINETLKKGAKTRYAMIGLISLTLLITSCIVVLTLLNIKKTSDQDELTARINSLIGKEETITSAIFYKPTGILRPVTKPIIRHIKSDRKHYFDKINQNSAVQRYSEDIRKGIISNFELQEGGFTVKQFQKAEEGFELTTISSLNMSYKTSPPFISYLKPNIESAYEMGLEYYKNLYASNYDKSKYYALLNVSYIRNQLYLLENKQNDLTLYRRSTGYSTLDFQTHKIDIQIEKLHYKLTLDKEKYDGLMIKYGLIAFCTWLLISALLLWLKPLKHED